MRAIFSILFWIYFALSCITLFALALILFLVTYPVDRNARLLHLYSCLWAAHYLYINPFWALRVDGVRVPRDRPYVIVANHQSFADILVLFATYLPYKWVSKASVFKVPFLGWNMRLNRYVAIQRGEKSSIERMMRECRQWLDRGVSVLLFPEGTRSPDGAIRPFKLGAFRLAQEVGVPLLPVVVDGTAAALPKHGAIIRASADCRARLLSPIDPATFPSAEAAAEAVRERMIEALGEMRAGR